MIGDFNLLYGNDSKITEASARAKEVFDANASPEYEALIVEGTDNTINIGLYDDDGITVLDITGSTALFTIKSDLERKEYVCSVVDNENIISIPNTETFLSERYEHRLELTHEGVVTRVLYGTVIIEKDI